MMRKITVCHKINVFLIATLLIILTCTQLPNTNAFQDNCTNYQEMTNLCFIGDEWENS